MTTIMLVLLLSGEQSFDQKVVVKLTEMLGVETPGKIMIERVEEKELLSDLKQYMMRDCLQGRIDRFPYCSEAIRNSNMFVHGIWLEKERNVLHIKLHKHAGLDALIHEFCHWYLHHLTKPPGMLNNHEVLLPLAMTLLVSEEFVSWLEKEKQ